MTKNLAYETKWLISLPKSAHTQTILLPQWHSSQTGPLSMPGPLKAITCFFLQSSLHLSSTLSFDFTSLGLTESATFTTGPPNIIRLEWHTQFFRCGVICISVLIAQCLHHSSDSKTVGQEPYLVLLTYLQRCGLQYIHSINICRVNVCICQNPGM